MYDHYLELIRQVNTTEICDSHFKNEAKYRDILEHVTENLGREYLKYIRAEFPHVTTKHIVGYTQMNDAIGRPDKNLFTIPGLEEVEEDTDLLCSPSSLRYVYHSLMILEGIRKHPNSSQFRRIIELGCGYGGLFLAIIYFRERYFPEIVVEQYFLMDLPDVLMLVDSYLKAHGVASDEYTLIDTFTFGKDIVNEGRGDLFLISNYCLTELSSDLRDRYYTLLIPKCSGGFIIWQTILTPLNELDRIPGAKVDAEERPQTSPADPNYFVSF
jgi:hypothetical protein